MKRIEEIDALRGFALFGIVMTHMFQGFLASIVPPEYIGFNIIYSIDHVSKFIVEQLFVSKFYAIFSMLFGLSFYLILDQKKHASPAKFAWRLILLFIIGFVHHIHYRGDFLTVYAVFGMILILCRKLNNRIILILGLFLAFNGPEIIIKTVALFSKPIPRSELILLKNIRIEEARRYFDLIIGDDYLKLFISNSTVGVINKCHYLLISGRLWVVPGLFLLGLWIGRKKWHENIHKLNLKKLIRITALFGFPLIGIYYYFAVTPYSKLGRFFGYIAKDAANIFIPLLYICIVLFLYKLRVTQNVIKQFIPVGKMGLTTYVAQSVFGIFIFYGYGLNLLLELSGTMALILGLFVFILQVWFSKWWFKLFKYGPLEWLWRCGTERKWIPNNINK
ncbi:DUF418 domain-containing protein [Aestuariibaculum sediminum]|uniref:DUF418 domain-containing protein n=1 Tax=Aestuariibaculum sediminum TaxID=2770637 RepID=A0A8J6Q226_9FLAO|nr:DUF418 domain-containing protein [Aestuariibaculum sediminum]MBD0831574.1 DUF418 domain-containing protein [Aestuariibaculum sediminum]